jgi:hypothetical protein
MNCCDGGARYAKRHSNRGEWNTIWKDSNKESKGNRSTTEKDAKRRSGLDDKEGYANGGWKDEATSNLVERRINVFQSVIAETVDESMI